MLLFVIVVLIASAATAYGIGAAFSAPGGSFLRTKRGRWLLVILGLTFVPLPPQLVSLDTAIQPTAGMGSLTGMLGAAGSTLAWPSAVGKGTYIGLWIVSSIAALLVGLRIWQIGSSEWRGGGARAYDASPTSRVNSMLPLANSLDEALDTLARARLGAGDAARVADDIRSVGRRYSEELPEKDGAVYQLVTRKLAAETAGPVTGYLLEGAGRRSVRS